MEDLLCIWLYEGEQAALNELAEYEASERDAMISKAKAFAEWLAKHKGHSGDLDRG